MARGGGERRRGCHDSFSLHVKAQRVLNLLAIETGKLQTDDGDITNNDDNSTSNVRSHRHFSVFSQGVRLQL